MKIDIPYGKEGTIPLNVKDEQVAAVLTPNTPKSGDERSILGQALSHPLGSSELATFLNGAKDVIFIVNDSTRPTPTARILESVLPLVPPNVHKKFIVACGSHRPPTDAEYRFLLGESVASDPANTILYHDAKDKNQLTKVGETDNEDVIINSHVANADRVVVISSVEPHYFAGFTGGRKSFLPGVAAYEVIERNHSHALDRTACTLSLSGNPVHDRMEAFARVAAGDKTYGIMTVVDSHSTITGAAAGDLFESFKACVGIATDLYTVPMAEKAEIVVTVAPHPMDINLYQSQKAIENGKLALKEGGVLILVSSCPDGIGPGAFYDLLKSAPTPQAVMEKISCQYKLGFHKAAKLSDIQLWAEIWAYTDMDPKLLDVISIKPVQDLQNAVDEALSKTSGKIVFMLDGSVTVPMVKGSTVCSK